MTKKRHGGTYQTVVAADNADEAIAIAAEALPPGAETTDGEAVRTADGISGTWQVTLTFKRGKKRIPDPPGLSGSGTE